MRSKSAGSQVRSSGANAAGATQVPMAPARCRSWAAAGGSCALCSARPRPAGRLALLGSSGGSTTTTRREATRAGVGGHGELRTDAQSRTGQAAQVEVAARIEGDAGGQGGGEQLGEGGCRVRAARLGGLSTWRRCPRMSRVYASWSTWVISKRCTSTLCGSFVPRACGVPPVMAVPFSLVSSVTSLAGHSSVSNTLAGIRTALQGPELFPARMQAAALVRCGNPPGQRVQEGALVGASGLRIYPGGYPSP